MKRVLWSVPVLMLIVASSWLARASYTYYYSQTLYPASWSNWIVDDVSSSCQSEGYCGAAGWGGTALYNYGYGGNRGEVRLTIRRDPSIQQNEGYSAYFGANDDPNLSTSTFYQLSVSCNSGWASVGVMKRTQQQSGYVSTDLASASATCTDPMVFRAVLNDTPAGRTAIIYLGSTRALKYTWTPTSDESSIGQYNAMEGFGVSSFSYDYGCCTGVAVTDVDFGIADNVAPNAVPSGSISKSAYINHVDLSWPATTDNTNGTGVYGYEIYRNGNLLGSTTGLTFSDTTVNPSTTYAYTLRAVDYHGWYADTAFNVTTPYIQTNGPFPSVTPEGRRVGVRSTGAYWGAGGENIDVMSGNLNFTLPLVKAQARSGWGVGFNLNYNSQNWRYDSGGNWNFGGDVGYGFGWQLLAGSITPVLSDPFTISYYLFTDSTGAEYRLDQNSNNIWTSKASVYVSYDATAMRLYFRDGSFWYFGCISASAEADSGVMYPTLMQDTNGNQVLITYQTSPGASWSNSSARITQIEDARGKGSSTYTFTYNNDTPRHLTAISSNIGDGQNYSFTYLTGQALYSPFNSQSFGTVAMMRRVTINTNSTYHEFTYNGSGELTQILLPYKGYLSYDYTTTTYSSSRSYREVLHRNLSKDGVSSTQYPFSHEASPGPDVHQYTVLDDPGGVGEKYWTFATSGLAEGLVTQYQGRQLPGPVTKVQNDYTWAQDAVGNSYIASATTTADLGQSYAAAKKTDQTVDTHGNVIQVKTYEYGNLTTPVRTDNYTYLTDSLYTSRYIFNRLTTTPTTTIAYDEHGLSTAPGDSHEWVQPVDPRRGNPTTVNSPGSTQSLFYDFAGGVRTSTTNGVTSTVTSTTATNYTVPSQVTVGSLSSSMTYNSFLGLTNETDPNGSSATIGYDAMARPSSTTSPFGATTTVSYYDTSSPAYSQTSVNGRWAKTTMDGLGRTVKVETGYSSTTVSVAETEYDSCGCSPTGKMKRTALPHAPGATPVWTTYTYDGIGRTLTASTAGTETTSTTSYSYQGNTVTVTDATGKWKTYTTNSQGQLIQVNEPNPAGGSDYVTTYTYDTLGHLIGVSMPRPSGTQTRTFNYGNPPGAQLLSATNPENGTVTYSYNSDNTLATKTDAKNQQVQYSYDSYKRVTQIRRGTYNGTFNEDTCQQENYYYDAGQYGLGRLTSMQYKGGLAYFGGNPTCDHTFTETFTYNSPGGITSQSLGVSEPAQNYSPGGDISMALTANYTYDNEGRVTATQYPSSWGGYSWVSGPNLGNTFDSTGRLQKLTDLTASSDIISNATYGAAGQLLTMTGNGGAPSETRTYNSIGQLTQLQSGSLNLQYAYSATQNNGKIASETDVVSGEQVAYTYDSLNRLASATSSVNPGWGQSYTYDGFGNLTTQTVIKGTAPSLSVTYDPATNQQTGGECADANGNLNASSFTCGGGYIYDVENRIVAQNPVWLGATPTVAYSYKPGNKRVWKGTSYVYNGQTNWSLASNEEVTFWSISGQKLVAYNVTQYQPGGPDTLPQLVAAQTGTNYYFGGKLVKNSTGYVTPDRLGSIGKYFPYGQERPSATTDGTEKFATYFRDSETELDYAVNRYEQPGMGRFMTPDPYIASGGPRDPGSWNRYAYTRGDPVNRTDPSGLDDCGDSPYSCTVNGGGLDPLAYFYMRSPYLDPSFNTYPFPGMFDTIAAVIAQYQTQIAVAAKENEIRNAPAISNVQARVNTLLSGISALQALQNPDCAALFSHEDHTPDPATFLSDIINRTSAFTSIQYSYIGAENVHTTLAGGVFNSTYDLVNATTNPTGTVITLNTNSLSSIGSGDVTAGAVTLLHELGHVYGFLFGATSTDILNDAGDSALSKANTALIKEKCFK